MDYFKIIRILLINILAIFYNQTAFSLPLLPNTFHLKISEPCDLQYGDCWRSSNPIIDNNTLYVGSFDGELYAIAQDSGKIIWKKKVGNYYSSSPIIYKNSVVVGFWGDLYQFNKKTGAIEAHFLTAYKTHTPAIDQDIAFASGQQLYAFDLQNQSQKWEFVFDGHYGGPPLVANGQIFVGAYDFWSQTNQSAFYAIDQETGYLNWKFEGEKEFRAKACISNGVVFVTSANYITALDEKTGEVKWQYKMKMNRELNNSTPECNSSVIFVGGGDWPNGYVYALNKDNGTLQWKYKTDGIMGSPALNDNVLYIGSEHHTLYAIYANSGKLKWRFKADGMVNGMPLINKGRVYFVTMAGSLYAIDKEKGV